ncbi:hypothetical protein BHE74_00004019 [Ensete ventricosum]|nr:hypothetical protein BHE74_00004019 [Ensete ventricosum]
MAEELADNPQLLEGDGFMAEAVPAESGGIAEKRIREEAGEDDSVSKRQKPEGCSEEEGTGGVEGEEEVGGDMEVRRSSDSGESEAASIGPKVFTSSVEMFDYFLKLLRSWLPNVNINKVRLLFLLANFLSLRNELHWTEGMDFEVLHMI